MWAPPSGQGKKHKKLFRPATMEIPWDSDCNTKERVVAADNDVEEKGYFGMQNVIYTFRHLLDPITPIESIYNGAEYIGIVNAQYCNTI